jgi:hypothetical protein
MARPKRASLSDFAATKPTAVPTVEARQATEEDTPGRRGMTLRLHPDAWKQLKFAAVEQGVSAHEVLLQALNDWFAKHGKPPIA